MMLVKWTGVFCVLASGLGIGYTGCIRLKKREHALREIIRLLRFLQEEIRFGNVPLREAFHRASGRINGEFRLCLEQVAEAMGKGETDSFSEVFRKCAAHILNSIPLSAEEKKSFLDIGNYLQSPDIRSELQELEHLQNLFTEYLENLHQEMTGKLKIYKSMGFFAALMIIVLIW